MNNELPEKSLKLLADPCKLKNHRFSFMMDPLQRELEAKFHCSISHSQYQRLLKTIEIELLVSSILDTIINQL